MESDEWLWFHAALFFRQKAHPGGDCASAPGSGQACRDGSMSKGRSGETAARAGTPLLRPAAGPCRKSRAALVSPQHRDEEARGARGTSAPHCAARHRPSPAMKKAQGRRGESLSPRPAAAARRCSCRPPARRTGRSRGCGSRASARSRRRAAGTARCWPRPWRAGPRRRPRCRRP